MTSKLVAVFLLGIFVVVANSLHIPGFIRGKPLRHHLDKLWMGEAVDTDQCAKEYNFTQIVDHFDSTNKATWNQLYQVNDKFFNSSAPVPIVFFMIGGESPAEQKWVCRENYTYMELAAKYNALVIQLEHRFFGRSYPVLSKPGFGDMSTGNLSLLTSQQALEDMANFIRTYNNQNNWKNAKWVAFGGSYPGSLCAWFRAQYSDLTVGGICSSAPLWAKVDFYEYAEVMEYAIRNRSATNKGQSFKDCPNQIQLAFATIRQMVYTDAGRQNLTNTFKITPPLNAATSTNFEMDATNFLAGVFNSYQGVIQYTYDARDNNTLNGYDLDSICRKMTDTSKDVISRVADVYFWTSSVESGSTVTTFDNDYNADMAYYKKTSFNLSDPSDQGIAAAKGWMWLCCGMALGWLQTTDNSNGIFYRAIPLNYYLQMCTDMFGTTINTQYVTDKVAQIQYVFPPPWNYTATNVVLPNGNYDPWHALGTYVNDTSRHQITLLTQGAAHCSDMYPKRHDGMEPIGLEATRVVIRAEVDYYVQPTTSDQTTPGVTDQPTTGQTNQPTTSVTTSGVTQTTTTSTTPSVTGSSSTTQKSGAENKAMLSFLLFSIVTFFFLI